MLGGKRYANKLQTKATFELMKKHRIQHVHYLEVPDLGHAWPPVDWFEKGIQLLDEPLKRETAML